MNLSRHRAIELLREFPNAATMTLARRAYKESPELWPNLDACRKQFRTLRGANGKKNRAHISTQEFFREPEQPGDPFDKLPDALPTVECWNPVHISGPRKIGVIADAHIPYHNTVAVRTALEYCRDRGADTILLNGDISDCFAVSFWEKDPRNIDFAKEIEDTVAFLSIIREAFPAALILYKLGNHEERFIRYMRVKALELLKIPNFSFESLCRLDENRITLVKDRSPIKIGALYFLHGHEYRFAIQNPVSPARGLFMRAKVSAVCGHFHQTSQHSEPDLDGHVVSTWGTGCLCDLHPAYMPLNKWNYGFAFVEVDATGAFSVDNLRIVDGKVWH